MGIHACTWNPELYHVVRAVLPLPLERSSTMTKVGLEVLQELDDFDVVCAADIGIVSDFYKWLVEQVGRNDPIGDLAHDVEADENLDRDITDGWSQYGWVKYLRGVNAVEGAIDALRATWVEYEKAKEEEGEEIAFRRGYCDGFLAAVSALERGHGHTKLSDHYEQLRAWRALRHFNRKDVPPVMG